MFTWEPKLYQWQLMVIFHAIHNMMKRNWSTAYCIKVTWVQKILRNFSDWQLFNQCSVKTTIYHKRAPKSWIILTSKKKMRFNFELVTSASRAISLISKELVISAEFNPDDLEASLLCSSHLLFKIQVAIKAIFFLKGFIKLYIHTYIHTYKQLYFETQATNNKKLFPCFNVL